MAVEFVLEELATGGELGRGPMLGKRARHLTRRRRTAPEASLGGLRGPGP